MVTITNRPLTVTEAANALGLPGRTPGARAQFLRRLEARGVLPPARRTLATGYRYYDPKYAQTLDSAVRRRIRAGKGGQP